MNYENICRRVLKTGFVLLILCVIALNLLQPTQAGAQRVEGNPPLQQASLPPAGPTPGPAACQPGTGWVWTTGPLQPESARQAEQALGAQGLRSAVTAFSYGEKDSCGNFESYSMDFRITLQDKTALSESERQELKDSILSILSQIAHPQLGNTQIDFGSGEIRFYPGPESTTALNLPLESSPGMESAALNKKVYLLVYNPILSNGQDFNTYMGWTPYSTLVQGVINSFQTASHGQVQYSVVYSRVVSDQWPVKIDGFRYTEQEYLEAYRNRTPHEPNDVDYDAIIGDPRFDICGRLNRGEIDELWIYGGPYDGFYESRLVGPDGYWFNSPPMEQTHGCSKLLPIMGLNFERGVPEAMESFGHRTEATITRVYGSWEQNKLAHNWNRFTMVKAQSPAYSYSGCGNIHYPANGVHDYDWDNPDSALTYCEDFQNYPNLSNPPDVLQAITCTAWDCNGYGYLMYWYGHLPIATGCTDGVLNNWWQYFADPNKALYPSLSCPSPTCPTITAWKGEYWSNPSLTGPAVICRDDQSLSFDWELGSPSPILPNEGFSARWTRTVHFDAGRYIFNLGHDDGARLYIDDMSHPVLDRWGTCCTVDRTDPPISLSQGNHVIKVEYFESGGAANAALWWEPETVNGWTGEYFNNEELSGYPVLIRDDPAIDFEWYMESPDPMVVADHFSARWTRWVNFSEDTYTFTITHDDGVRLYIDDMDSPVFENWCDDCVVTDLVEYKPSAGWHQVRLAMRDVYGYATAKMSWQATAALVNVRIGQSQVGSYPLGSSQSTRQSYNMDNGLVRISNSKSNAIIASERINLKSNGAFSSYAEVMGLPASKLSDTYIFPWYNNTGFLDSQLRFANVGNANTVVTIKIGGTTRPETFNLAPSQSTRVSFAGVDSGPVEVKSSGGVPIIAALRINLKVGSPFSSYSEFLGLSASNTASTRYIFPWYNNTGLLDSQLRFGNVGNQTTTVTVKIGGVTQPAAYTLSPNESTRVSYSLDDGPVEVTSSNNVPITAAMRINLKSNTAFSSYTELMGLTGATLTDTRYFFPWYNNTGLLDSQLRFGNAGNATTTVTIKVNGVPWPTTYSLAPNQSTRVSLAGVNNGPVEVSSSGGVPIIAALRINLKNNAAFSSYYEFMGSSVGSPLGLPGNQLSTTYWFPWYNNTGLLDSQLRFGVP